ncbi:MAG TPA: GGDEF domain-containing protein [Exilispira sp.]|nr:GGDEF domain-containing protein [Exilispira sp.]
MKLINKRFVILEKKKDFNSFSLYLVKDNKNNQLYYLLFQIKNNILINNFNSFIQFIIEQKRSFNPSIISLLDFFYLTNIDDVAIDSPAFFLLYPFDEKILLDEFLKKNYEKKDEIFNKIIKINRWIGDSEESKFSYHNSIVLVDNNELPYLLPIFTLNLENIKFNKEIDNFLIKNNIENNIDKKTEKNLEKAESNKIDFNIIFSYFENNDSTINYLFFLVEYIFNKKLEIFSDKFNYPSYKKPYLYNFINFPSSYSGYCEDFLSIISKKGIFNFLSISASPDKYSLIYDTFDKIKDKYNNEIQFLHLKTNLLSNDINTIKHSILESFYLLSMDKPLIIQINNLNVADAESIKLVNQLLQINNLHFPINFIIFDYKNAINLDCNIKIIDFLIELELHAFLKDKIINSYSKLLYLENQDIEFIKSLELDLLISLIITNPFNIFKIEKSKILLKKDLIKKSIQNEINILISSILENEKNKEFFLYFLFFEKPTDIGFLKEIFQDRLFKIINKFIKDKLLFIDENNKLNSNLISTMRVIFQHLIKTKFDRKEIIDKISKIYLKYIDEINLNETFLCFKYLCELKEFSKAAYLIDYKLLLPLISDKIKIKQLFFHYMQNQFNYGKNIDFIEDNYSKLIFKLFYYKLKYLNYNKKLEICINELEKASSNYDFHYRFVIEKILYYISIHNTEKIEKDITFIQENFYKLPEELKKIFFYAKSEDYYSRYDHKNSVEAAKSAIKILNKQNKFDSTFYLPILHRMVNSIIYRASYKKANSYLNYFLKKALELKDIKYIFYAYNNLGVVNYRNKEFEKARNFMISASFYAKQLQDKTLIFINYNNLNLLEMDKKLRISRSMKMLKLAPYLAEKTYLILSFCNIFLYLLEEGNFQEIFKIVSKYKNEIFQRFENYSLFTIRRFLHLYTILTFIFYLFEKKEYLQIFYENLAKIKEKIEKEDEKSELKYLYNIIEPILSFLLENKCDKINKENNFLINSEDSIKSYTLNEKKELKRKSELSEKIKKIFLSYSNDKDKIINTEFFATLIGIYGLTFFDEDEFLNLIKGIVEKFGKDLKVCNIDLVLYYRIKTNKRYSDKVLIRYIEKYFKLHDIDPWTSSGIFFKSYIFLTYLKLLKNTKNIEKFKLYLIIFKEYFEPFFEFINSDYLFFPQLKNDFDEIINIVKRMNNFKEKTKDNLKYSNFSSINFIKLPKNEYDKDYYKNLLIEFSEKLNFDRAMLYIFENKEMKLKEIIIKEPILYFESEPSFSLISDDIVYPKEPIFKKIKNSDIYEILYLPIYFVNAIPRIISWERYDKRQLQPFLLQGYIYFDSKIPKNRTINYSTLQFASLYLSELFERMQLEKLYMHDYLTRVLTRENFFKKCNQIISLNKQSIMVAFMMIDIDNFKKINDTYGHQKGDIVLSKLAQTIKNSLRTIDIVGRYGGEEFTVCLPDTSVDNAFIVAERIRANIEDTVFIENNVKITVSIGLSFFPQDGIILEDVINKADKAMYKAKNKGKNRIEFYQND